MNQPSNQLTVVICTRNRSDLLLNCLKSLSASRRHIKQVIIVDSSSASELSKTQIKIQNIGLKKITHIQVAHVNLAHSKNIGLRYVKTSIFAFIDDDACAHNNWAKNIISVFAEHSDLIGAGGQVCAENNYWSKSAQKIYIKNLGIDDNIQERSVDGFAGVNCAFKTKFVFQKQIHFDENYKTGEDVVFCFNIKRAGGKLLYTSKFGVRHMFRTTLKQFFWRYHEYSLDEYIYWKSLPEYSDLYSYIPASVVGWIFLPITVAKKFIQKIYKLAQHDSSFTYVPGYIIYQLAYFIGIYQQHIIKSIKSTID